MHEWAAPPRESRQAADSVSFLKQHRLCGIRDTGKYSGRDSVQVAEYGAPGAGAKEIAVAVEHAKRLVRVEGFRYARLSARELFDLLRAHGDTRACSRGPNLSSALRKARHAKNRSSSSPHASLGMDAGISEAAGAFDIGAALS